MKNPYDEEVKRLESRVEESEAQAKREERDWHRLNQELRNLPKWKIRSRIAKKKEIVETFERMNFFKANVIDYRDWLRDTRKLRDGIEYARTSREGEADEDNH